MPIETKNITLRYRLIDRLLRDLEYVKTRLIIERLYDKYDISVGPTTVQRDIRNMTSYFNAPINYCNSKKAYYYPANVDEIFPIIELIGEEVNALLFYAKTITQYEDYPIFNEFSKAIQKVIDASNIPHKIKQLFEQQTLIETEKHPPIQGLELITELLEAISNKKLIEVKYKRFNNEPKKHVIQPILLKEDKLMWYLIGVNKKYNSLITFGLDRIVSLKVLDETFKNIEFNSAKYFEHSFGITVLEAEPIEVNILFEPEQGNYLKTLPIHNTQEIIEDNHEKFIIKVKVRPSYEFYSKILSYGKTATIISPDSIKNKFLEIYNSAISNYKSVK